MELGETCLSCQSLKIKLGKLHSRFSIYKEKCNQNDVLIDTFRKQNLLLKALKEELAQKDTALTEISNKFKFSEVECKALRQTLEKEKEDYERNLVRKLGQTELEITTLRNEVESTKIQLDAQRIANTQLTEKLEEETSLRKDEKETFTKEKKNLFRKNDLMESKLNKKIKKFSLLKDDKNGLYKSVLKWLASLERRSEATSLEANLALDTDSPKRQRNDSVATDSDVSPLTTPQQKSPEKDAGSATDSSEDSDFEEVTERRERKSPQKNLVSDSKRDVGKRSPQKISPKAATVKKLFKSPEKSKDKANVQMPTITDLNLSEDEVETTSDVPVANDDVCFEPKIAKNQEPSEKACITSVLEDASYHRDAVSPLPGIHFQESIDSHSRVDCDAPPMESSGTLLLGGSAQGAAHGSSPVLSKLCVICVKLLSSCSLCVDVLNRFKDLKDCERLDVLEELNTPPLSMGSMECNEEERSLFSPTRLHTQERLDFPHNLHPPHPAESCVNAAVSAAKNDVSCQTSESVPTTRTIASRDCATQTAKTPSFNIQVQTDSVQSTNETRSKSHVKTASTQTVAALNFSTAVQTEQMENCRSRGSQTNSLGLVTKTAFTQTSNGEIRGEIRHKTELCKNASVQTDSLSIDENKTLLSRRNVRSVRCQTDRSNKTCDVSTCSMKQFFQSGLTNLINQANLFPNYGSDLAGFAACQPPLNVQPYQGAPAGLVPPTMCIFSAPNRNYVTANEAFYRCNCSGTTRKPPSSFTLKKEDHTGDFVDSCEKNCMRSLKRKNRSLLKKKLLSSDYALKDGLRNRCFEAVSPEARPHSKKNPAVTDDSTDEDVEILAVREKRKLSRLRVDVKDQLHPEKKSKKCRRSSISCESESPLKKRYSRIRTICDSTSEEEQEKDDNQGKFLPKLTVDNPSHQKAFSSSLSNTVKTPNRAAVSQTNDVPPGRTRNTKDQHELNTNTLARNLELAKSSIRFVKESHLEVPNDAKNYSGEANEKIKSPSSNKMSVDVEESNLGKDKSTSVRYDCSNVPKSRNGAESMAQSDLTSHRGKRHVLIRQEGQVEVPGESVKSTVPANGPRSMQSWRRVSEASEEVRCLQSGSPCSKNKSPGKRDSLELDNGTGSVENVTCAAESNSMKDDVLEANTPEESTPLRKTSKYREDSSPPCQMDGALPLVISEGAATPVKPLSNFFATGVLENDLCLSDESCGMADHEDTADISKETGEEQNSKDVEADEPILADEVDEEKVDSMESCEELKREAADGASPEVSKDSQLKERIENSEEALEKCAEKNVSLDEPCLDTPAVQKRHLPAMAVPLGPPLTRRASKMLSNPQCQCNGEKHTGSEAPSSTRTCTRASRSKRDPSCTEPTKRKRCTSNSDSEMEVAKKLLVEEGQLSADALSLTKEKSLTLEKGLCNVNSSTRDSGMVDVSGETLGDANISSSCNMEVSSEHVSEPRPSSSRETESPAPSTVSGSKINDERSPCRKLRPRTCQAKEGDVVSQRRSTRTRTATKMQTSDSEERCNDSISPPPEPIRQEAVAGGVRKASKLQRLRSTVSRLHPLAQRAPPTRTEPTLEKPKSEKCSEDLSPEVTKRTGSLQMPKSGRTAVMLHDEPRLLKFSEKAKALRKAVVQQISSPAHVFTKPKVSPLDRIAAAQPTNSSLSRDKTGCSESEKADSTTPPCRSPEDAVSWTSTPVYKRSNTLARSRPSPHPASETIPSAVAPPPQSRANPTTSFPTRPPPANMLAADAHNALPRKSTNMWCDLAATFETRRGDSERTAVQRLHLAPPVCDQHLTGPALVALIDSTERDAAYSEEVVRDGEHPLLLAWHKFSATKTSSRRTAFTSKNDILSSNTAIRKIINRYLASGYFTSNLLDTTARSLMDPKFVFTVSIVARLVVETVQQDYDSHLCSDTPGPGQFLTKIQQQLVALVMRLFPTYRSIVSEVLLLIEFCMFQINSTRFQGDRVLWLARMHTALCRIMKWRTSSLIFCYDAMYCYVSRCHSIILSVFQLWPQLLPGRINFETAGISAKVLFHYVMTQGTPDVLPAVKVLRDLFISKKIYSGHTNSSALIETIITHIKEGLDADVTSSLVLVAKREAVLWAKEHIVDKHVLPMIRDWALDNKESSCASAVHAISTLCAIVRAFQGSEQSVKTTMILMKSLLLDNKAVAETPALEHAVCAGLVSLARHDIEFVVDVLVQWKPQSQPQLWLVDLLHSLIRNKARLPFWWRNIVKDLYSRRLILQFDS